MPNREIAITGMGCISPIGNDVESTWEAISSGQSGVDEITLFDASEFKTRFAAEVKGFDPKEELGQKLSRRTDRFTQFAVVATEHALQNADLQIDDSNRDRIGAIIGTGVGGLDTLFEESKKMLKGGPRRVSPFLIPMMLANSAPGQLAITFGLRGPNMAVVTACASGSNAIGEGAKMIARGAADVIVVGGTEAAITPIALAGFNRMDAVSTRNDNPTTASRPFDLNRDGFVLGEGCGILILESIEHARERGAEIIAELAGYGTTNDAFHISAPAQGGAGAASCMQVALEDAGINSDQIDYINAHGTSTRLNDSSETEAIKTVFGEGAYDVPVSSTKSMTGHLLGAAGAIEAVICIKAMQEGLIPATTNYETPDPACDLDCVPNESRAGSLEYVMSNSFGFGGHNASLIFKNAQMIGDT